MTTNQKCTIVSAVVLLLLVGMGALLAYGAAIFVSPFLSVLLVAGISFYAAPDFECRIFAAILTILAIVAVPAPALVMLLPGAGSGFLAIFRTTGLLEWLYPPFGQPMEEYPPRCCPFCQASIDRAATACEKCARELPSGSA